MPFEDELSEALRRTGDAFEPDRTELTVGGLVRGRRRLLRRRVSATAGGLLALAAAVPLTGIGDGLLDGPEAVSVGEQKPTPLPVRILRPEDFPEPQAPDPKKYFRASASQMLKILEISLPDGKLSGQRGTSNFGSFGEPAKASLVYDDGFGGGMVSIAVSRIDAKDKKYRKLVTCPDKKTTPYEKCSDETDVRRPEWDPTGHMMLLGYEDPKRTDGVKQWKSVGVYQEGYLVEVTETNAPAEGAAPSRAKPPLTKMQLSNLTLYVQSAFNQFGGLAGEFFAEPKDIGGSNAVMDLLPTLLPKGMQSRGRGGLGNDGYSIVWDGKAKTHLRATIQGGVKGLPGDVSVLPDGTEVVTSQKAGKAKGAVEWTVDSLHPNGMRVTVTAYNSEYPRRAPVRDEHAFTMEQLRALATDKAWTTLK
ncbi:hypothetical protein [Streptomyces sp. MS1.AVA.4]|uniref:Uncharacterized protein n=1 Tax=Streptomyces pratisoli TaxID=3139917 RepID=A0ACC6QKR6_9ACTN